MTRSETLEVVRTCERLRATKRQVRMHYLFGGAVSIPDEDETREVPINPDGPEAADLIERLAALLLEKKDA